MHRGAVARIRAVAVVTFAGALVVVTTAVAADAGRSPSSCVACHTDSAKLTEEAKGLPQPAASALQAGKG